jgi:hypothetical protein
MDLHALTAAPFQTDEAVTTLLDAFHAGTLPRGAWNHRAHLTVALTVARLWPSHDATAMMRDEILRFNAAAGIESTPDSGYHETLTAFYMAIVRHYVTRNPQPVSPADDANQLVADWGHADLPLSYYSRERLFSREARVAFVAPDLAPMPPTD